MTRRLGLVLCVGWSFLAGNLCLPANGDESPAPERPPVSQHSHELSAALEVEKARLAKHSDAVNLHNLGVAHLREGQVDAGLARLIQASLAAPRSEIVRRHLQDAAGYHGVEIERLQVFNRMAAALRWRNLLLIAGAVSFWIGAAGWLVAGRQGPGWLRTLCGIGCLLGAVAVVTGVILHRFCPTPRDYMTFEKRTALQAAPSEQAPTTASLPPLQIVRIIGEKEPWAFVENSRGEAGWVPTTSILPLLIQK